MPRGIAAALALVFGVLGGCVGVGETSESFRVDGGELRGIASRMKASPVGLERPLVVVGGYRSPFWTQKSMAKRLRTLTGASDVVVVQTFRYTNVENAADAIINAVERSHPSGELGETVEVDVVALSMGGLASRAAAIERDDRKRLRINRLFTIATPHQGASITRVVRWDPATRQMREGSAFLDELDAALETAEYELVPYAVLRDLIVSESNAFPEGMDPIWVPGPPIASHYWVYRDERIMVDIARRLRGEEPIGIAAQLPAD